MSKTEQPEISEEVLKRLEEVFGELREVVELSRERQLLNLKRFSNDYQRLEYLDNFLRETKKRMARLLNATGVGWVSHYTCLPDNIATKLPPGVDEKIYDELIIPLARSQHGSAANLIKYLKNKYEQTKESINYEQLVDDVLSGKVIKAKDVGALTHRQLLKIIDPEKQYFKDFIGPSSIFNKNTMGNKSDMDLCLKIGGFIGRPLRSNSDVAEALKKGFPSKYISTEFLVTLYREGSLTKDECFKLWPDKKVEHYTRRGEVKLTFKKTKKNQKILEDFLDGKSGPPKYTELDDESRW